MAFHLFKLSFSVSLSCSFLSFFLLLFLFLLTFGSFFFSLSFFFCLLCFCFMRHKNIKILNCKVCFFLSILCLVLVSCLVFSLKSLFLIFVFFAEFQLCFLFKINVFGFKTHKLKTPTFGQGGVATKRFFFNNLCFAICEK